VLGVAVLMAIQALVPRLHNVASNPMQDLISGPRNAAIFAVVVVVAGGVREEIQRAFILHRFDVWLGGGTVGLIVGSIAFGAGHIVQGYDAAVATGLLGVFWGAVYLRRRSVIAPIVSHSGFNLLELLQYLALVRR
jgi:membrane protease YdiL (CAAX protease family)